MRFRADFCSSLSVRGWDGIKLSPASGSLLIISSSTVMYPFSFRLFSALAIPEPSSFCGQLLPDFSRVLKIEYCRGAFFSNCLKTSESGNFSKIMSFCVLSKDLSFLRELGSMERKTYSNGAQ